MAAIGDSITQAYDDCCSLGALGAHPQDSWSTGDGYPANGIESHYVRILAMNPSIAGRAYNDSVVGATVADTESQAQLAVAQGAQYVTILIGANDVCTGTIASMTPTSAFQAAFQTAMSTLESGLPAGSRIFVSSIPNIYDLWSVLHTNPLAEAVWSLAGICQSMLSSANTEAQRQQVLAQVVADNAVLGQVCGQYANCRWDGNATFDYQFSPSDVSVVDYFHPSQTGQAVLAGLTWAKSWWPLTTAVLVPASGATVSGSTALDATASNATSVEFWLFGGSYGYSGHLVGTATPTIYGWLDSWNTTTVANGSYVLLSEAFGSGGSTFSSGVSITVKNPPTTNVLVPSNGAKLSGSTYLDASASNATSVVFALFGGSYGLSGHVVGTATPTLYGWLDNWNTTTVSNGSYVLLSYASGPGGSTASSGVSVTVSN